MVPEIDEGKRTKGRERERKRKREVGGGKEEGYERGRRGRIRARQDTHEGGYQEDTRGG
jgi:hypothetical protein